MTKASTPRVQTVQTPGVAPQVAEGETAENLGDTAEASVDQPAVAPDIAAMVQAEVARILKVQADARAQAMANPAGSTPLPTQAEALAQVNADPKRRSVLSKDGWVVTSKPLVEGRDESGFAKA